jgi:hypothetical protein
MSASVPVTGGERLVQQRVGKTLENNTQCLRRASAPE